MSAFGPKQTSPLAPHMSAFGGYSDFGQKMPDFIGSRILILIYRYHFPYRPKAGKPRKIVSFTRKFAFPRALQNETLI
jgi:hypothetical protein